jgi:hypothetical protein
VSLTGVHLRVLGGRPVWPLAYHQFVTARYRHAFVEQRLEWRDILPVPFRSGSVGTRLLEGLLVGYCDEWGSARVPAVGRLCAGGAGPAAHEGEVCDSGGVGGEYEPAVSACVPGTCVAVFC